MRIVRSNVLDVKVEGRDIFSLIKDVEGNTIRIVRLEADLEGVDELVRLRGSRAFLLKALKGRFLVSVDNSLILVDERGVQKTVLKTNRIENFFWHISETEEGYTFIQEYGGPPTGIYVSEDLESWRKIVTNVELDRHSKHFHSISWDPYRGWIIATLGDGCLLRVVYSEDLGRSWKPLHKGAWQFIPVIPLKDRIVFGMDSGIVKGGVGIFYPEDHRWEFKFFRWQDEKASLAQMCSLKLVSDGLWIATFGTPQAVTVSKDLLAWYPIHVEGYDRSFNFHMSIDVLDSVVLCSTGNYLIAIDKNELRRNILDRKPIAFPYKAYYERLIGFSFLLKRKLRK